MPEPIDEPDKKQDEQRVKISILLLAVGCIFILTSTVVYVRRSSSLTSERRAAAPTATAPVAVVNPLRPTTPGQQKVLLLRWILYSCMLVLIFMAGAFALRRWSRAYRAYLRRQPSHTTPTTDVWSMHRLPREGQPDVADDEEV